MAHYILYLKDGKYVVAISISSNGDIDGEWTTYNELLYDEDGGHGMTFKSKEDRLYFTLHTPNTKYHEHPIFLKIKDVGDRIIKLN